MSEQFSISGQVLTVNNAPVDEAKVIAYDKDLPSRRPRDEEVLGEAWTDREGNFTIGYGRESFTRADKRTADLLLRVFQGSRELVLARTVVNNTELRRSTVLFNAPPQSTAELTVRADDRGPSEYEILRGEVDPVLDGMPVESLTDDDVAFIAGETDLDRDRIDRLVAAARAAGEWSAPVEGIYALARMDLPLDLERLVAAGEDALRDALRAAIDRSVISAAFTDRVDETVAQLVATGTASATQVLRLREEGSSTPPAGWPVRAVDVTDDARPRDLGVGLTDAAGLLTVRYPVTDPAVPHLLRLTVQEASADDSATVVQTSAGPVDVLVRAPMTAVRSADLGLPPEAIDALETNGLGTLAALRRNRTDLRTLPGFPADVDDLVLSTLSAHADLSRLATDPAIRTAAIEKGYSEVAAIAVAPRSRFVAEVGDTIGDIAAARLHAGAAAQLKLLDAAVTAAAVDPGPDDAVASAGCDCGDCQSATGPLAYLADLLRYATEHLADGATPVGVPTLEAAFAQPFGDLPVSCRAAEQQVRQVRLVCESLRRRLRSSSPSPSAQQALEEAEATYRLTAYQSLLSRLGTSYEEVRRLRADPAGRSALADRLGVLLTVPAPAGGDEIERLCLDPAAPANAATALTDTRLDVLFGLADTARDPLSAGPALGDNAAQVASWTVEGAAWGHDTTVDGSMFLALTADPGGGVLVELFADPGRSRRLASAMASGPLARVALAPEPGSRVSATVDIAYTEDTLPGEEAELVAVPRLLGWRLARLRQQWSADDAEGRRYPGPIVDPDLVTAATLADPVLGRAATLWQQRSTALADRADHVREFRSAIPRPTPADALDAMVQDTLGRPATELTDLVVRVRHGDAEPAELGEWHLTGESADFLARMRVVAAAGQDLTGDEWDDVVAVLVQSWKQRQYPTWRTEEQAAPAVTLSPDHFRPRAAGAPAAGGPRWRYDPLIALDWSDLLQARIAQEAAVVTGTAEAVSATEETALPALRDALVLAAGPDGADPAAAADWASGQLLVDARAGGCQQTTRVAHAIEALQAALSTVHSGQYRAEPALTLQAPAFAAEWHWIGSYGAWRSASFVNLRPETLLLPALFTPKTPAFATLLDELGSVPPTAQRATALAAAYAGYFEDVCNLEVGASCVATTRVTAEPGYATSDGGYRCLLFLFGRAPKSGRLYFSLADPENPAGFPQRPWTHLPTGDGVVTEIIGAVPYQLPTGARYVYVFAKRQVGVVEQLVFLRMDVDTHAWDPVATLGLPGGASQFSARLVARPEAPLGGLPRAINYSTAPQLLLRIRDLAGAFAGHWYERQLSDQGDGWEGNDFAQLYLGATMDILAVVDQGNNALFTVTQAGSDLWCVMHTMLGWASRQPIAGRRYGIGGSEWFVNHRYAGSLIFRYVADNGWMANELYLLTNPPGGGLQATVVKRAPDNLITTTQVGHHLPATLRIPPAAGGLSSDKSSGRNWFAFGHSDQPGRSWFGRLRRSAGGPDATIETAVAARSQVSGPFDIAAPLSATSLQLRRALIEKAYAGNETVAALNLLAEAYFLVPVAVALELARAGDRATALEWFRLAYDFTVPVADRKISHLLRREETLAGLAPRAADWLLDPLAPHRIAATRRNAYTKYIIAGIAQCMIDDGDAEFATDSAESRPRARRRYEDALALLTAPEVAAATDRCAQLVGLLGDGVDGGPAVLAAVVQLRSEAMKIGDPVALGAAVDAVNTALALDTGWPDRVAEGWAAMGAARATPVPTLGALVTEQRLAGATARTAAAAGPAIDAALVVVGASASSEMSRALTAITGSAQSVVDGVPIRLGWLRGDGGAPNVGGRANALAVGTPRLIQLAEAAAAEPATALDIVMPMAGAYTPAPPGSFCVPPNPAIEALRARAQLNLRKLRTCRNISGMVRAADMYAAPTDATSGMPTAVGGTIATPGLSTGPALRPTQYRYPALIDRAKQLAQLAGQMESAMLHALEAGQAAQYARFKATQEVAATVAGVRLQNARLGEASRSVTLATLQQNRAALQATTYQSWIQAGITQQEKTLLSNYNEARDAQIDLANWDMRVQMLQTFATAAAGGATGAAAAMSFASLTALALMPRTTAAEEVLRVQATTQANALYASIELRQREWELQRLIAQQDVAIAGESIALANAHVEVVSIEKDIAETNASLARDTLEFLGNQFLNDVRYAWMSQQYERAYLFFLREATATARLAANELAFARQAVPPVEISESYWTPARTSDGGPGGDQHGLTGSARLLEDLYRLDQYAFASRKRSQTLTKTFSLARLYPLEFQRFRETGVLPFATPMSLFDRDFPGHYLRQIQRVRASVIALIPPVDGVHATLSSTGISRVVIGPDVFQTVVVRRDPESVSFTAPTGASSPLELEPQAGDLRAPFEGYGVDTTFELRMARAANTFDYRTTADVLLTMEYTSIDSVAYREQVIQSLPTSVAGERPFSLVEDFPDAWYDLHNPELLEEPQRMRVTVRTSRSDFPPNLDRLHIDNVLLYFVRSNSMTQEVPVSGLRFVEADSAAPPVGGAATTVDGIVSTRRGNGAAWQDLVGRQPTGDWELELPRTAAVQHWFKNEQITDILLVVSYSGRPPAWPA